MKEKEIVREFMEKQRRSVDDSQKREGRHEQRQGLREGKRGSLPDRNTVRKEDRHKGSWF